MNCIVAQSGGPTAAINASLAGVITAVSEHSEFDILYGAIHGIQGVLREQFQILSDKDAAFTEQLMLTPAMYLGSCRYKLPDPDTEDAVYSQIFKVFERYEIGAFFYIGGNDSMDTVDKLSSYGQKIHSDVRIVGIPKTIDNDLILTDHTPGFGSAAKYIATIVREIAYDSYIYDVESATIVEIMGRDAGWLTAASVLARTDTSLAPHRIYLPEVPFHTESFLTDLSALIGKHRNVVIAVSEGIRDAEGNYISATEAAADRFGHAQLSGAGKCLENLVKDRLGVKVRSVEVNVLQRCAAHLTSGTDIAEAAASGRYAVERAAAGETAFMSAIYRMSDQPYRTEFTSVPVSEVANRAKEVPREMINDAGNDVTDEMIAYLKPLVVGENIPQFESGIPDFIDVSHLTRH